MSEQDVVFGERLRRRRMALGWSQVEFARRIGVGPAAISRYEGGTYKSMEFVRLRPIAETLQTSTDYLLGLTNDPGPVPDRPCPGKECTVRSYAPSPVTPILERTEDEGECTRICG